MEIIQPNEQPSVQKISDEPKISFLETVYGVLFSPRKLFDDLYDEDTFTVLIYGVLAVFLSNLGKMEPGNITLLNIFTKELLGFFSWFFVSLFISFLSIVFKTPHNNFGKLLGFTGLSTLPFLLLAPIFLLGANGHFIYKLFSFFMFAWTFVLFCIAISKSLKLETWRVVLFAIVPFSVGTMGSLIDLIMSRF